MTTPQDLLAPLIVAARTPGQYRELAAELERIAAMCRAYAAAQENQQRKPPAQRINRKGSGKAGRPSAPWVQVLERERAGALPMNILRVSASLYYAAGSPERLDVQRVGAELRLVPVRGDAGYKCMVNPGGIRINASGARDIIGLDIGKYSAEWRAGAIIVGERL